MNPAKKDISLSDMRNRLVIGLDFKVDKLTKSIEEISTGESKSTLILPVKLDDLLGMIWQFDWGFELEQEFHFVYKLVTVNNPI